VFKWIFANPERGDKVLSAATSGLDKAFFTKEERADASAKVGEWYLKWLAATDGQNLARRLIAFMVVFVWSALVLFCVAIRWVSFAMSDFVLVVLRDVVMQPFSIVIGFYFLTHAIRSFQKGK